MKYTYDLYILPDGYRAEERFYYDKGDTDTDAVAFFKGLEERKKHNFLQDPKTGKMMGSKSVGKSAGGESGDNEEVNISQSGNENKDNSKVFKSKSEQDVTDDYYKTATPGKGKITCTNEYKRSEHKEEITVAHQLHKEIGGDIELLTESKSIGEKTPDYFWNGKSWELKSISSEKAADSAIRNGIKQIDINPGGIILDCKKNVNYEMLQGVISYRINRSAPFSIDVIIMSNGKIIKVLRYKK